MGSWDFTNIGFSCEKKNVEQVEELFECMGIDCYAARESEDGEINDMFWNIIKKGSDNSDLKIEEIYSIVNTVFENTTIYYQNEEGNNTSDWYSRYEMIFDPNTNKVYYGEYNYCVGNGEDREDSEWEKDIEDADIKKEYIIKIIDIAAQNGYNKLVKKITKSFELDYVSPFFNDHKERTKKLSRAQLDVAKDIDKLNAKMEEIPINEEILLDLNKPVYDNLHVGDVIELFYCTKKPTKRDEYIALKNKGKVIGLLLESYGPEGIQGDGGLVFSWAIVKRIENGMPYLEYKYRYIDLSYESIRREILDCIGENDRIHVIDIYKNEDLGDDYDERNIVSLFSDGNYVSKEYALKTRNDYKDIYRGFELHILKMAKSLGVDFLKYDLNAGYIPDYSNLYNKLMNDIGNRFEVSADPFFGGNISILNLEMGDELQLHIEEGSYNKCVMLKKENNVVGCLSSDVTDYIIDLLGDGMTYAIAEIVDIVEEHDCADEGIVYTKIIFKNK